MPYDIFYRILELSLAVSLIIIIVLLLQNILHDKFNMKWRYWLWMLLAFILIIPFNIISIKAPIQIERPNQVVIIQTSSTSASSNQPVRITLQDPVSGNNLPKGSYPIGQILFYSWITGIVISLMNQFTKYQLFKRSYFRFCKINTDQRINGLMDEVRRGLGIRKSIQIYQCLKTASPFITGFLKPILLMPTINLRDDELKIIFTHELIHYKRKDTWFKLLLIFTRAVHWFNPVIYLMVSAANKDIEMVCDSEVVKNRDLQYRKQYSDTILSVIQKENIRNAALSTYFFGNKKTLKQRLVNILDVTKKRKGILVFTIILVLTLLMTTVMALTPPNFVKENIIGEPQITDTIKSSDELTSLAITTSIINTPSSVITPSVVISPTPIPTILPGSIFNADFNVSLYDYSVIDEKHQNNITLTKFENFAYAMKLLDQNVEYKKDLVIVTFQDGYSKYHNSQILTKNGLDVSEKATKLILFRTKAYLTINNTSEGVKNAIILLFQDENVFSVMPNVVDAAY